MPSKLLCSPSVSYAMYATFVISAIFSPSVASDTSAFSANSVLPAFSRLFYLL